MRRIVVAIKGDERDDGLIEAAASLARGCGLAVELAHVASAVAMAPSVRFPGTAPAPQTLVDMIGGYAHLARPVDFYDTLPSLSPSGLADGVAAPVASSRMREHMERLCRRLERMDVSIASRIVPGRFPDALLDPEFQSDAALILAGATPTERGPFKPHFRRISKLVRRSTTSVLIIPDRRQLDLEKRPLRVLIADDLANESRGLIERARGFFSKLSGGLDVLHLHVKQEPAPFFVAAPDFHMAVWPELDAEERLVNDEDESLLDKLRRRGRPLRRVIENGGGSYSAELWHGNVIEELERAARSFGADLCLFGPHKPWHWDDRGVGLGHVSLSRMLQLGGACLVARA